MFRFSCSPLGRSASFSLSLSLNLSFLLFLILFECFTYASEIKKHIRGQDNFLQVSAQPGRAQIRGIDSLEHCTVQGVNNSTCSGQCESIERSANQTTQWKWSGFFFIDELKCHSYSNQRRKTENHPSDWVQPNQWKWSSERKWNGYRLKWDWIALPLARQLNGKATRTHNANRRRMLHRPTGRSAEITATNNCLRYRFDLFECFWFGAGKPLSHFCYKLLCFTYYLHVIVVVGDHAMLALALSVRQSRCQPNWSIRFRCVDRPGDDMIDAFAIRARSA